MQDKSLVLATFDEGYSEATRKAYAADWRSFSGWCKIGPYVALPAEPETVATYIEHLGLTHRPSTVARHLATVTCVHKDGGYTSPVSSRIVKVAMKRLWRRAGRRQSQATAITFEKRSTMLASSCCSLKGLRDAALLSLAYDVGCRRSETVSLLAEDIDRAEDGSGSVLLRRSKTDQDGSGNVRYLAPSTMLAINAWLDAAKIEDGLLFRSVDRTGKVGPSLTGGSISRIYKRMARGGKHNREGAIGISGHSTRVGMAQDMAAAGVDLAGIMQAGNWKSPTMVARYIERLTARNGGAAKLARMQGR